MSDQPNFYFLSPVEVMQVTRDNLEQVAEWCGGVVSETESRRVKGRMDKYVWVPCPKEAKISWAFVGMFVTRRVVNTTKTSPEGRDELKITWAVFRHDYFKKNYFETPDIAITETWGKKQPIIKQAKPVEKPEEVRTPVPKLSIDDLHERMEGRVAGAAEVLLPRTVGVASGVVRADELVKMSPEEFAYAFEAAKVIDFNPAPPEKIVGPLASTQPIFDSVSVPVPESIVEKPKARTVEQIQAELDQVREMERLRAAKNNGPS